MKQALVGLIVTVIILVTLLSPILAQAAQP